MAVPALQTAPVLSTPDTHIFEDPTPAVDPSSLPRLSDEQLQITYEIARTVREIREGRWKRIALQFPDQMLLDAPRVYEQLTKGLGSARKTQNGVQLKSAENGSTAIDELSTGIEATALQQEEEEPNERLFILGDTSYGACCVDEVAAEHVDADVVVHYGRSCLSPPSKLSVIYVFTERHLDLESVMSTFIETYPDKDAKIILLADIPYAHHVPKLHSCLVAQGYSHIFPTEIVHNPSSLLPNRTIPPEVGEEKETLCDYAVFHLSDPPTSLLLTLSSRVASIHIYSTSSKASLASTAQILRRRYALLTSLSTTPIFGILINTLSVKNYMHILSHVQSQITAAGKKYYTFVVGKINAAKVANFSEVGGWVVIGCWESSLIESREFWKPMITPWELELALMSDEERVWTGAWEADYQTILNRAEVAQRKGEEKTNGTQAGSTTKKVDKGLEDTTQGEFDSEEESAPPEFDLRTGRYVSHSRPMRLPPSADSKEPTHTNSSSSASASTALTKRANGEIAAMGGVASPGAEYLRSQRTWQGLGSDYTNGEEGEKGNSSVNGRAAKMEQGRSGIAKGYVVGEEDQRH